MLRGSGDCASVTVLSLELKNHRTKHHCLNFHDVCSDVCAISPLMLVL